MNSFSGRHHFEFGFRDSAARAQSAPESPLRTLILADFSGRTGRNLSSPLATRRCVPVDTDNLEKIFASFGATLNLPQGALQFEALEDFHPDQLLKRVAGLSDLLAGLRQLQTPSTATQGAQILERLLGTCVAPPASAHPAPVATARSESADETLARLLGASPKQPLPSPPKPGEVIDMHSIIKNVVGTKDITPTATAGQIGLRTAAELELSQRLRFILHSRDFQALEASWRALDFIVRRTPDEELIKYFALDITLEELVSDPTGLHRLLRDAPPNLLVANFTFGASPGDLGALATLAKLCANSKIDFFGAAHAQLADNDSFGAHADPDDWKFTAPTDVREAWDKLRATPEAAHIGLALPRFILRQPYGQGSDPIDSFQFEELPGHNNHEAFLWGNPAFLCTQRLAEVRAGGGNESAADEIGELPLFRYKEDGESAVKPCAEAWLTDRAAEMIQRKGLIPCLSIKNRDAVRVVI